MSDEAIAAFALLVDPDRLAVAGALAAQPRTTDDLAAVTDLPRRRLLEALSRLEVGELVSRDESSRWLLDVPRLRSLARDARPKPPPDDVGDAPADQVAVLQRFLRDGRVLSFPTQRNRRLIVLDHVARVFAVGERYAERDVNVMLRAFHDDYAALRRYLVDEGFLSREDNIYWRTGGSVDV